MSEQRREPGTRGVIRADEAYTLEEAKRRLGVGDATIRQARKRGLKVRRIGRNSYVLGEELLAFLREAPAVAGGDDDN